MGLMFKDGVLLFDSGVLAMDPACCCGGVTVCDPTDGPCGTSYPASVTVTLPGCFNGGGSYACANTGGADWEYLDPFVLRVRAGVGCTYILGVPQVYIYASALDIAGGSSLCQWELTFAPGSISYGTVACNPSGALPQIGTCGLCAGGSVATVS